MSSSSAWAAHRQRWWQAQCSRCPRCTSFISTRIPLETVFICLAGGCLGVLFVIPLRRYFVREMHGQFPFPEATAITEVLVTGEKGGSQAKLLLQATCIAGRL